MAMIVKANSKFSILVPAPMLWMTSRVPLQATTTSATAPMQRVCHAALPAVSLSNFFVDFPNSSSYELRNNWAASLPASAFASSKYVHFAPR
jgi:hypothetical protein